MTCKDCIHRELCAEYVSALARIQNADVEYISQWLDEIEGKRDQADNGCEHFADHSRFVKLPCNVGDMAYFILRYFDGKMRIKPEKICYFTIKANELNIHTTAGYFTVRDMNEGVFFTRKEAEQALKKREEAEQVLKESSE